MNDIKWYDYLAAIYFADIMSAIVISTMTATVWVAFFNGFLLFGFWNLWKFYCEFRKK
jgi:hypothetical protein